MCWLMSHCIYWGTRRCNASTCAICLRTCTGDPIVSSPRWSGSFDIKYDSTINPLSQSNTNNSSPNRRRLRDEDNENTLKAKDVDSGRSGCGQMVCRTCCFEHPQRSESIDRTVYSRLIWNLFSGIVACLGCSVKPLALQSHESLHMPQFKELEIQTV